MLFLKYLLLFTGLGLLAGAAAILLWDLYAAFKRRSADSVRWYNAARLAIAALLPLFLSGSIAVVPGGNAGVKVNQFVGVRAETLYPGVHFVIPAVEKIELYNVRDQMFTTSIGDPKRKDVLRVQTQEGLTPALAVAVRYRIEARRLAYINANLPQPVESELVGPAVESAFREVAPKYLVREIFSTKREQMRLEAAKKIGDKLARDGIEVKEVVLRDIELPAEYARGLEGLLVKEQENERMNIDLEVKQKLVKTAELEAEAQKAREVKEAEAQAEIVVLQAKAQADAMQHTLPLKQKQIEQSKLEASARKEATVMNAEASAEAKVIDSKAELEKRKLMSDADEDHIRKVAAADADRLKMESEVYSKNPLLIQKIIAEKLSDKVQIMMVPSDGKFFFANDVLKGMPVLDTPRQ
jgi:regulator of protease activity HflC (stomatin/prohibitin superfamily)